MFATFTFATLGADDDSCCDAIRFVARMVRSESQEGMILQMCIPAITVILNVGGGAQSIHDPPA